MCSDRLPMPRAPADAPGTCRGHPPPGACGHAEARRAAAEVSGGVRGGKAPPFPTNPSFTRAWCELAAGVTSKGKYHHTKNTIHTAVGKVYELALLFNNSKHLPSSSLFLNTAGKLFGAPRRGYQASLFL